MEKKKSMTVVLCAKGYPGKYKKILKLKTLNKIKLSSKMILFIMQEQNL